MDEILLANFMVFHDVVRDQPYDLWIGDEAWELDYYLHENPELKTAPFCFLTDFVGWLPMPEGGDHEAFLTADYNAEMIEQIARFPRVRDKAIFVGNPDDIVPHDFGDGLPKIRPWVEQHFEFSGYVLAPDAAPADQSAARAELGLPARGAGVRRHRRRIRRRHRSPPPGDRGAPPRARARARATDDRRLRATHRPSIASRAGRPRGAPVRRPAVAPPRRLRRRGRPRRAHHVHGARRSKHPVPLLPPAPTLRAEPPRPPPPRALPAPDERSTTTTRHPRRSQPRSQTRSTAPAKPTTSNATAPPARPASSQSCSSRPAANAIPPSCARKRDTASASPA